MFPTRRASVSVLCVVLLPVLAAACATPPTDVPTEVPPNPTALQLPAAAPTTAAPATSAPASAPVASSGAEVTGASLYQVSCAACHGADLKGSKFEQDGQTISVPALGWDDLNSMYQTQPSRGSVAAQLGVAITKGQNETGADLDALMPRWSTLSQPQVDSLVLYLQAGGTAGAAPTLTPAAMNLSAADLYVAACAACHGADAAGKTLEKDNNKITTPSLHWSELTQTYSANPSRGTVAEQLALSITKGQDETGADLGTLMPRWSFLSQGQVDSLVLYLQTTFK